MWKSGGNGAFVLLPLPSERAFHGEREAKSRLISFGGLFARHDRDGSHFHTTPYIAFTMIVARPVL